MFSRKERSNPEARTALRRQLPFRFLEQRCHMLQVVAQCLQHRLPVQRSAGENPAGRYEHLARMKRSWRVWMRACKRGRRPQSMTPFAAEATSSSSWLRSSRTLAPYVSTGNLPSSRRGCQASRAVNCRSMRRPSYQPRRRMQFVAPSVPFCAATAALATDSEETVDLSTRQSCLRVTARDLAVMAATLASGGVNPSTGTSRRLSSAMAADRAARAGHPVPAAARPSVACS